MNPRSRDRLAAGAHATADELALFVIDGLDQVAQRRFERHIAVCALCAQALAQEAAAELQLQAVWPQVQRPLAPVLALPRRTRTRRPDAAASVPAPGPVPVAPAVGPGRKAAAESRFLPAAHGASWNALAAAAMTVLFLGYWTGGGKSMGARAPGSLAALQAALDPELSSNMSRETFSEAMSEMTPAAVSPAGGVGAGALVSPLCPSGDGAAADLCGLPQAAAGAQPRAGGSRWACSSAGPDDAPCAPRAPPSRPAPPAGLCREPVGGICEPPALASGHDPGP